MGGMNNRTSIELAKAKRNSKTRNAIQNKKLYKDYLESGEQFSKTFTEWKESKFTKRRPGPMQKKPTTSERKASDARQPKSLNQIYRYK